MNNNIDQSDIQKKFIIHTPDTDAFVLCLGNLHEIHGDAYIKTVIKDRSRIIISEKVKEKIGSSLDELGYTSHEFCEALIGLHAFTGFMKYQQKYVFTFKELGEPWNLEEGLFQNLEEFICVMYGDQLKNVNDLRYKIYC